MSEEREAKRDRLTRHCDYAQKAVRVVEFFCE
jgi:hypothetical protein